MAISKTTKTKGKTGKPKATKKVAGKSVPSRKSGTGKKVVAKAATKKIVKKPVVKKVVSKPAVKAASKPAKTPKPHGVAEQIRDVALKVLDERQAEEIFTVDLSGKSSIADYLIIASGRASRQLSAIAHYLREAFEKLGLRNIRVEGLADANWVLVDAGDVVVHLFRPEVRDYYNLESMWSGKKTEPETV